MKKSNAKKKSKSNSTSLLPVFSFFDDMNNQPQPNQTQTQNKNKSKSSDTFHVEKSQSSSGDVMDNGKVSSSFLTINHSMPSSSSTSSLCSASALVSIEDKPSLKDIPPEMLNRILKSLSTRELFFARLVNRNWNELCSSLLRHRSDPASESPLLIFSFNSKAYIHWKSMMRNDGRTLHELTNLYESSPFPAQNKNFPFTKYKLSDIDLQHWEMREFFEKCGSQILSLQIDGFKSTKDIQYLKEVLLVYAPNIRRLSLIHYDPSISAKLFPLSPNFPHIPLFPPEEGNENVQLDALRHLSVRHDYSVYGRLLDDIIRASVKLKSVSGPWENVREQDHFHMKAEDLEFFNNFDKVHLLKSITIFLSDTKLAQFWQRNPTVVKKLRPNKLILAPGSFSGSRFDPSNHANSEVWLRAFEFLNRVIQQTKDTIVELELEPLGDFFVNRIDWDDFSRVRKLVLCGFWTSEPFFHRGVRDSDILQNVTELCLKGNFQTKDELIFPTLEFIPFLPSVRILNLSLNNCSPTLIQNIALMCPHARSLTLEKARTFCKVLPVIWTNMRQLTSLAITVLSLPENSATFVNLISDITGYSGEALKKLCNQIKVDTTTRVVSEISYDGARALPSIFDLPDLAHFRITVQGASNGNGLEVDRHAILLGRLFSIQKKPGLQVKIQKQLI